MLLSQLRSQRYGYPPHRIHLCPGSIGTETETGKEKGRKTGIGREKRRREGIVTGSERDLKIATIGVESEMWKGGTMLFETLPEMRTETETEPRRGRRIDTRRDGWKRKGSQYHIVNLGVHPSLLLHGPPKIPERETQRLHRLPITDGIVQKKHLHLLPRYVNFN
jgi:hypothetical protein